VFASHLRRRASSISATRRPPCTIGCSHAARAERLSCVSRTRTSSEAKRNTPRCCATACSGLASTGTKVPRSGKSRPRANAALIASRSGSTYTAERQTGCSRRQGLQVFLLEKELDAERDRAAAEKRPPRYTRNAETLRRSKSQRKAMRRTRFASRSCAALRRSMISYRGSSVPTTGNLTTASSCGPAAIRCSTLP